MTGSEDQQDSVKPSEQRGGTTPGERESREKGEWAARAAEGVVPPELGGSDAPREALGEDPEPGSSVLGETSGSEGAGAAEGGVAAGGGTRPPGGTTPPPPPGRRTERREGPRPAPRGSAGGPPPVRCRVGRVV